MLADTIPRVAQLVVKARGKYYPRPSLAGPERCERQMVYWGLGTQTEKELPGRAILTMDDSSWHEELTLDWLRKTTYEVHSEQMAVNIPMLFDWMPDVNYYCRFCQQERHARDCHGHIDCIVKDLHDFEYLFEHKAVNHFSYQRIIDHGELPLDNLVQFALYLRGVQRDAPHIDRGVVLFKNKNTAAYAELMCHYDGWRDVLTVESMTLHTGEVITIHKIFESFTGDAVDKFRMVHEHIAKKTLPDRPYKYDHWRCEYCQYFDTCWESYVEEVGGYIEGPELPSEMEFLLNWYTDARETASAAEKERKEAGQRIRQALAKLKLDGGGIGDQTVKWSVKKGSRIDYSKIPADMVSKARVFKPDDRLNVRKVKPKGE